MPTNSNKFLITDLDIDGIKSALKAFLQSQSTFSDYNFEGAGLSVLLNILSYNTHYLSYYLNMVANEMFIDSADLRESVISLAKMLGYTPRSRNCAEAFVNVVVTTTGTPPATAVMDKNTKFNTTLDGVNYTFLTDQAYTAPLVGNTYTFNNVTLVEGSPFTFASTFSIAIPNQRFIIPNANVDTKKLIVRVQNSSGDLTINVFTLADDINELTGTSLVYFLKEVEDQQYEVYFGDGVIGKALQDGNIVILDYIACNADAPNNATGFTAASPIAGFGNVSVTTTNVAFGGAERESIESVRFSAPLNFEAQNRAVTQSDYVTILTNEYPNADSVSIWGGEDNDPPVYGKVFVSIKPVAGFFLTPTEKQHIINDILASHNVVTVIPTIVDPDYTFLIVTTLVKYDPKATTKSADQIKALVIDTINNFNTTSINKFNRVFRYSNLGTAIDNTEFSINGDVTIIEMQKRFSPILDKADTYTLKYNNKNPIVPGSLNSSLFICTQDPSFTFTPGDIHGLDDDQNGNVRLFKQHGTAKLYVKLQAGTIDYTNAVVTLKGFIPHIIVDGSTEIKINVVPVSNDVTPVRNNIVTIDPIDVNVNMESEPR